jgi:L-lactate dehydrogenase complex protein LldG
MNARERILAKLRAAAPASPAASPEVGPYYDAGRPPSTVLELAHRLKAQMDAAHAEAMIASAGEWPKLLGIVLAAKRVRRLLIDAGAPAARDLLAALPKNIEPVAFDRPIEAWKSELFETVDASFTVADAGIAATGTLIFASSPQAPRTASLVPPLHVALVYAETIYPDMHAAASGECWAAAMPTNLVMVSGPSKTSDIQQTLAYGAHGPKEMVVVIVLPGEGARP